MEEQKGLRLYDYYLISYFPVFLAIVAALFLRIVELDTTIDFYVPSEYFSVQWVIRILVFFYVSYMLSFTLRGDGWDGVKAGAFVGIVLGLFYGLFLFFYERTLGTFFYFLALPWQTMITGIVIIGSMTFFLSLWRQERESLLNK